VLWKGSSIANHRPVNQRLPNQTTRSFIRSSSVGTDLSKDDHYAINEDGSEYDDDVGGPVYAAGRDGVDLESLSAEQDATAKDAARNLFDRIQRAAAPTHRG
jgi:hypothetical protein